MNIESDQDPVDIEYQSHLKLPDHPVKVIDSHTLFGADQEIWISHEGEVYRLRITRKNKLILQK